MYLWKVGKKNRDRKRSVRLKAKLKAKQRRRVKGLNRPD
jgi:hypothetical protein